MLDEKDFQDWNIWRPAKRNYLNSLKKNYERQKRMKKILYAKFIPAQSNAFITKKS